MKDLVIKRAALHREMCILAVLLLLAEIVNLAAIIHFGRPAVELLSQLGYVVLLALVVYMALWIVRIIVYLIVKIFKTK
ncbi:MAG: hypothetical protein IJQ93_01870 [Bacteroidales bacterium]|nr:hypothetical protein [Bacteroidales bacterium]